MNKEIPCYVISDLLPLYQDDILSEQTKKDIDRHLSGCEECRKKLLAMKMQIDVQSTDVELKSNPLKKVKFYQKMLTAFGAVIAFVLGACAPIAILGLMVLERGEIAVYQIERVKSLWYILALWCCVAGIALCVIYFLLLLLIRKITFLYYLPYSVLAVMVFPVILFSTSSIWSGIAGTAVALLLAYFRKGLLVVALSSIATVFVVELAMMLLG